LSENFLVIQRDYGTKYFKTILVLRNIKINSFSYSKYATTYHILWLYLLHSRKLGKSGNYSILYM